MSERQAMTMILWDVDHTLIENGGVSKENYRLAFEKLTGKTPAQQPQTDGRTDIGIMRNLMVANGYAEDDFSWEEQQAALIAAGAENRDALEKRGHALPGAAAAVERVASIPGVIQSVLTGNVEPNAIIKLAAFGLDSLIDFSVGGFGSENAIRGYLVPVAQQKAAAAFDFDPASDHTVLFGDTTLDVRAGLIGGARIIAVATGISSEAELVDAGADVVLPSLEDTDAVVRAIEKCQELGPTAPRETQIAET